MARFSDIAHKKIEDTERPPLPPVGWYVCEVIKGELRQMNSAAGDAEIVEFTLRGVQAGDDVDLDELTAFGGAKGLMVRNGFYFNNSPDEEASFLQTENRLKKFLREHLNIPESEAEEYLAAIELSKGRLVMAEIGHRPDKNDPDIFYPEVKKTMPA